jgi:hypothetical protein
MLKAVSQSPVIDLEEELAGSRYDAPNRRFYYTVQRGARRWTISASVDDLDRHGRGISVSHFDSVNIEGSKNADF